MDRKSNKKEIKKRNLPAGNIEDIEEHQMARGQYIKSKISQQNIPKKQIAKYIVSKFVKDFDAVLLDAGSTAEFISKELFTQRKFLTVMTNNMGAYASYTQAIGSREKSHSGLVAGLLNENELLLTGGRFDITYEALFGDATLKAIQGFTPNVTIIGVSGLRFNDGIYCHGSEEVRVKRLLWTIPTDTRIIASDWTKIGRRDAYAFGPQVSQLKNGARMAVIVTSKPPREADSELRKEFDEQVQLIKESNIRIEII